jgi:hypothetical protein
LTGIKGAANTAPNPLEVLSIADAAAECGVTVETFVRWMVRDGMLLEHLDGGYVAAPHPDVIGLDR